MSLLGLILHTAAQTYSSSQPVVVVVVVIIIEALILTVTPLNHINSHV